MALGSPAAARLLDIQLATNPQQHRLLQLAVAVHQTAEDICQAGWIATDESVIDLNLVSFSGQSGHQQFVVGLLASYLQAPAPAEVDMPTPTQACTIDRMHSLIGLCNSASPSERAGALRLLGDEALFAASMFPAVAHRQQISPQDLEQLKTVLPKAVVALMQDLETQLVTLLDVYLTFGPVWYRMAAQALPMARVRDALGAIATDFVTARRFLVRVAQGPLLAIKPGLYPNINVPIS